MKKLFTIIFIITATIMPIFFAYKLQKVEAVNQPGIWHLYQTGETQDPATKMWTWKFELSTQYVADGTPIDFRIYKNDTNNDSLQYSSTDTKINNGGMKYVLPPMLDKTTYIVSWRIQTIYRSDTTGVYYTNLTATYECKTGNTSNCSAKINNALPVFPDDPTIINAKAATVFNNSTVYKMLAPIGDIKCMDSSGLDKTCISNNIGAYLNVIFKLAIGICAALAVIMLIINGVKYMGDESIFGKTEAKKGMFGAIVGLLIALGAWALLNTINPALTGQNGLTIDSANAEIENEQIPWSTYEKGDNKTACPSGYIDVPTGATPTSINVCSTISKNLSDLIAAAKKDGYTLSGHGSRSIATTQALRVKNNCPEPKTPSSQCKPNAVAIPGGSNHEKGLAVDFNCNGKSMQPDKINTNNVCYVWLTKNAGTYGFKNNFSALQETWHWSTNGY